MHACTFANYYKLTMISYCGLEQALLETRLADQGLVREDLVDAQPRQPLHGLDDPLVLLGRCCRPQLHTPSQNSDDLALVGDGGHVLQQLQHLLALGWHLLASQHGLEDLLSHLGIGVGDRELLQGVCDVLVAHSQHPVVALAHHDGARRLLVEALVASQPRSQAEAFEEGGVDLLQ
jgi:hypothetical protein